MSKKENVIFGTLLGTVLLGPLGAVLGAAFSYLASEDKNKSLPDNKSDSSGVSDRGIDSLSPKDQDIFLRELYGDNYQDWYFNEKKNVHPPS